MSPFLDFLAVFASVWYNDSTPIGDADRPQTFLWLSQTAQRQHRWPDHSFFSPLGASPAVYSDNVNLTEKEANNLIQDIPSDYQDLSQSEETAITTEIVSKNEFHEFIRNFFAKIPEIYLNAKADNGGWREFVINAVLNIKICVPRIRYFSVK